ncbi:ABC transporter permease [Falsiroseomonas sp. HW251]|uniref:ABC transporter permease n=1 Tax=Falsiroseomonas sp. HW251 TaxID=3390998 RepID=UPI003D316102
MPSSTPESASASPGRTLLERLLRRWTARFSLLVLAIGLVCAVMPDVVASLDPYDQDLLMRLLPPAWVEGGDPMHLLGTDHLGRDLLSRIVHGARVTLFVAVLAVLGAALVGIAAGLAAGHYGGRVDSVIMRLADVQLAFPVVLLVIVVAAVVGPSVLNLVAILALSGWPRFARIVRGSVLTVRELGYVEAGRAAGSSDTMLMLRHILPNVASPIIVYASFELARMILLEATMSFLGLGVQPPTPTWGGMINDGRGYLHLSLGASLLPGLAIALTILACNLLGDDLRDALDPRMELETR